MRGVRPRIRRALGGSWNLLPRMEVYVRSNIAGSVELGAMVEGASSANQLMLLSQNEQPKLANVGRCVAMAGL